MGNQATEAFIPKCAMIGNLMRSLAADHQKTETAFVELRATAEDPAAFRSVKIGDHCEH